MTRTEWLLEKKKVITSTDPACLLGIGFQSGEKIYRFKTTPEVEEDEANELKDLGLYLEGYIQGKCEKYFRENGIWEKLPISNAILVGWSGEYKDFWQFQLDAHREVKLQIGGYGLIRSRKNNWQATSIDLFNRHSGKWNLLCETKCVFGYPSSDWGPEGTDLIPEKYIIQCQHQMGVLEVEEMYLAALFVSSGEFRMYKIRFDQTIFDLISQLEQAFFARVVNRLGMEGWDEAIARDYYPFIRSRIPQVKEGTKVQLDSEAESLIVQYVEAVDIWSQMEEEAKSLKDKLIQIMGDAETGESEQYIIRRPLVRSKKPYRRFEVERKEP